MKLKTLLFAFLASTMTLGSAWAEDGLTPIAQDATDKNPDGLKTNTGWNDSYTICSFDKLDKEGYYRNRFGGGYESGYKRYNYWIDLGSYAAHKQYGFEIMKFEWSVPSYARAHVTIPALNIHLYNNNYETDVVPCLSAIYEFTTQSEAQSSEVSIEPSDINAYINSGIDIPYSSNLVRYVYNSGEQKCVYACKEHNGDSYTTVFDNSSNNADETMDKYWLYTTGASKSNSTHSQKSFMLIYPNSDGRYYTATYDYYKIITFDANGGTGTMSAQTIENSGTLTANAFRRAFYTFNGWNTEADGSGISYADASEIAATATDKGPVTLYAQWYSEHAFTNYPDVCNDCGHAFLSYTTTDGATMTPDMTSVLDADGNRVSIVNNTYSNGQGIIEFLRPIVNIGASTFSGNTTLTGDLVIPSTVKIIGEGAFQNITNLNGTLTIPGSVTQIGGKAFSGTPFTRIEMSSIPQCGENIFDNASSIAYTLSDDSYVYTGSNSFLPTPATESYTRTGFSSQWGTLVVPFALSLDGTELYDLYTVSSITDGVITITKTTKLTAGTPALIRMSGNAQNAETGLYDLTLNASNTAIDATGTLTGTSHEGLSLQGTYAKEDIAAKNGYFVSGSKFYSIEAQHAKNSSVKINLGAFRAYLAGTLTSNASSLRIGISEQAEETGIDALEALTNNEAEIYDQTGRRQQNLHQGINIIKHGNKTVKVIIK